MDSADHKDRLGTKNLASHGKGLKREACCVADIEARARIN
jgi:hypothetical protein